MHGFHTQILHGFLWLFNPSFTGAGGGGGGGGGLMVCMYMLPYYLCVSHISKAYLYVFITLTSA